MNSKTILITGSTDGIGRQTALKLAQLGHEVIVHGRSKEKSQSVARELAQLSRNDNIKYVYSDLGNFDLIQKMSDCIKKKFSKLDVLINNAGVFQNEKQILPNGLETTFMVNHMAVFALTKALLPLLDETPDSRIINVSSMAQSGTMDFDNLNGEKYFDAYNSYAVSKLENVLFTYKLHRILEGNGPTVNCLHPGVISTKLLHAGWGMGGSSLESGASTSVYLAVNEETKNVSGRYFVNSQERKSSAISYDRKIQDRLWQISEEILSQNQNK